MANRIGAARAVWLGLLGVVVVGWGLAACGDDAAPSAPAPSGTPDDSTGDSPDASSEPAAAMPTAADAGFEGVPPIGGREPIQGPPVGACTPGATQPCLLEQLCIGTATCAADGAGFGECECSATPAAGGGVVGAACESNADCAQGATCFRANGNDWAGAGGPAGGYCTFPCAGDADCTAQDPESSCVDGVGPNGASYCLRTCLSKDAEPGEAKCLNRTTVVCVSNAGQVGLSSERQPGFCAPRCGSDDDCPFGRVCHRQGGVCTAGVSPGAPTGTSCTLDTNCDGKACEDRIDGVGVCTAECVLGSLSGCGYGRTTELRKAACITAAFSAGRFSEGPGDLGLCRELCDVDTDCLEAANGIVCSPLNAALAAFTGRSGACVRAN